MIEVEHEPIEDLRDLVAIERCCFCRKPTRYWYLPKDVACCRVCAIRADHKDIPTKRKWCRFEDIARRRFSDPDLKG